MTVIKPNSIHKQNLSPSLLVSPLQKRLQTKRSQLLKNDLKIIELIVKRLNVCEEIGSLKSLLKMTLEQELVELNSKRMFEKKLKEHQLPKPDRTTIRAIMAMLVNASKQRQRKQKRKQKGKREL